VPSFCRHNRLIQNCPICSKEQQVEMRAVVSSSAPSSSRPARTASERPAGGAGGAGSRSPRGAGGVRVRRLARGADDGYHSGLVPGLRSSIDAERLAEEMAFAAARLALLESSEPPGLYAEVAGGFGGDLEERTWLAFLIACIGPLEETEDPFASIREALTPWAGGEPPHLEHGSPGPRTALDPEHPLRTVDAYRAWAARAGSQQAAFTGEASWTPERRFARTFERLALPGFQRGPRFDLLVTLGRLGVYELRAGSLHVGGENAVTLAAKRALGIGDPLLLDRRAVQLADACGVELEALDVALENWEHGERAHFGVGPGVEPDEETLASAREALGLA
jgi:hypothetical protein